MRRAELARFATRFCVLLCLVATLIQLTVQLPSVAHVVAAGERVEYHGRDIETYYYAARAAYQRQTPYEPLGEMALQPKLGAYIYPPPFAVLIAPLGALPPVVFYRVWFVLLEVALWMFCVALVEISGSRHTWQATLLPGPLALSPLLMVSFGFGQVDLFVFALCVLALVLALRNRPHLAALLLAAGACVKIYPVLLLLPLARRFGWRVLATAGGFLCVAAGLSAAWFGSGIFGDFVRNAVPIVAQGFPHEENISPAALVTRLAVWIGWADPALPAPLWLRASTLTMSVLMLVFLVWTSWRIPFPESYGWVAGLSILFAAYCFTAYWTMFLILTSLIWRQRARHLEWPPFALVLGCVLLASLAVDSLWFKGPLIIAWVLLTTLALNRAGRGESSSSLQPTPYPPP